MHKIGFIAHRTVIRLTNIISKPVLAVLMLFRLNVRYRNLGVVYGIRGPFLVLPNHTNQWDPFILSFAVPRPIHWVASDGAFRDSSLKWLLRAAGTIPKIKGQSDMVTLGEVKRAIAMGHAAGIFPEGEQSWDGRVRPLIPATAKLIRFLKVPVVVPLIKGGFLTKPRWAWGVRGCRIEVDFKRIIDADEIKTMKTAEIEARMKKHLIHDDYGWQKQRMVPIRSERRAEHMEEAHFFCPACEGIGGLRSSGNDLICGCGYRVHVNRHGFPEYPPGGPSFASPAEWIERQNEFLLERMRQRIEAAAGGGETQPVLLRDGGITLMRAERAMPMQAVLTGEARLYEDRIEVGDTPGEMLSFPFSEISGVNTFKQQKFEFRFRGSQYRFAMPSRRISGCKWETACRALQRLQAEQGTPRTENTHRYPLITD